MKNRRITCVDYVHNEMKNVDCVLEKMDKHEVMVDGNLITGGPPTCIPEALKNFYNLLGVKITIPQ